MISCSLVIKSCLTLLRPHALYSPPHIAHYIAHCIALCPWNFSFKNTGVGYFLLPGVLPDSGIEPKFPALAGGFFTTEPPGKLLQWSVSSSSVTQSCPTLCDPMNCSMPALPVLHQLPESAQTHVHWVGDAFQPSHPLSSPSPPALNPFQH